MRSLVTIVILAVLVIGCATAPDNIAPARLLSEPLVQSNLDPNLKNIGTKYATFTVIPYSEVSTEGATIDPLVEKHLMFSARNNLEILGYKHVGPDDSPDFFVAINGTNEYREHYVPPSTVVVPKWIPGTTTYHDLDFNSFGSTGQSWGTISGTSTTPGYFTTTTYTRPGYMSGAYYPALSFVAIDAKSGDVFWTASAVGASTNSDIRVSSQIPSFAAMMRFPPCENIRSNWNTPIDIGYNGTMWRIHTNNGDFYVPVVTLVVPGSPAAKAGIKQDDFIVSVNGKSVVNLSVGEIYRALEAQRVGETENLYLVRGDQTFSVPIELISENEVLALMSNSLSR